MRYELKDLRLFLAIVEAENLSAGAAEMHMTASSASYRLKNLEYAVGSALFLRTPKGMQPTRAGEVLVKHARKVMAEVSAMQLELGEFSRNMRGTVRLLTNSSALNGFVVPSLARFLTSNSSINVDLTEKESAAISHAIQQGQADIGIGADLEPLPDLRRELYALERLVCAVPIHHPLAQHDAVSFNDVLEHDMVAMDRQSSNFLFLNSRARLTGKRMNVRVHAQNFDAVLAMVHAGVGVAVVPASMTEYGGRSQSFAVVPIKDRWADRALYLVRKQAPEQDELIESFAQILLNDPRVVEARSERQQP